MYYRKNSFGKPHTGCTFQASFTLETVPICNSRSDIGVNCNTQPQIFTIKITFTLSGTAENRLRLTAQNKDHFKAGII